MTRLTKTLLFTADYLPGNGGNFQTLSMQIEDHHQISKLLHRGRASQGKQHARFF